MLSKSNWTSARPVSPVSTRSVVTRGHVYGGGGKLTHIAMPHPNVALHEAQPSHAMIGSIALIRILRPSRGQGREKNQRQNYGWSDYGKTRAFHGRHHPPR